VQHRRCQKANRSHWRNADGVLAGNLTMLNSCGLWRQHPGDRSASSAQRPHKSKRNITWLMFPRT
jgi:hypothetical protein